MKNILRHNIVCKELKVKMQYWYLEVTDVALESKILKKDIHLEQRMIDKYYLVLNYN